MIPLIDADVLRYEIGACGQGKDDDGELIIRDFDFVANLLDDKVREICQLSWADEPPILFLTSDTATHNILYRKEPKSFEPNFRMEVATTKVYKGTRHKEKPKHYANLTAYMLNCYDCVVAEGLEADDLMAISQTKSRKCGIDTIICSRDKDLRTVEGNHYGWECGLQEGFGPAYVSAQGELCPIYKDEKIKKLKGNGMSFFCAQMIMGDTVDNIPGLPRKGIVAAWELLKDCDTIPDMFKAVRDAYRAVYEDEWEQHFLEQARLLWMVRQLDEDGNPVMFEIPEYLYEQE